MVFHDFTAFFEHPIKEWFRHPSTTIGRNSPILGSPHHDRIVDPVLTCQTVYSPTHIVVDAIMRCRVCMLALIQSLPFNFELGNACSHLLIPHIATHYFYATNFDLTCAFFVVAQDLLLAAKGEIYPRIHAQLPWALLILDGLSKSVCIKYVFHMPH